MKILLIIFMVIVLLMLLSLFILCFSVFRINIKNIYINTYDKNTDNIYECYLEMYLFNKVRYMKIDLIKIIKKFFDKKIKFNKINYKKINKNIINNIKLFYKFNRNKKVKKKVKDKKLIKLDELYLNLKIDTNRPDITAYINFIITMVLTKIYFMAFKNNESLKIKRKKITSTKYDYNVKSMYNCKNDIMIDLKCIINIKVVNAINIIIKLILYKRKECKK